MRGLVSENLNEFLKEGVGDKYAERKWGISDPESDLEKSYKEHKAKSAEHKVGEIKGKPLLKNPDSLSLLPNGARGVITENGDLYIVADSESLIHTDILEALKKAGKIKGNPSGWEDPMDIPKYGFVAVQRVWNKPIIAISESYIIPKAKKDPSDNKKALEIIKSYFLAAKRKNPHIKFVLEKVRPAARHYLNDKEIKEYRRLGS